MLSASSGPLVVIDGVASDVESFCKLGDGVLRVIWVWSDSESLHVGGDCFVECPALLPVGNAHLMNGSRPITFREMDIVREVIERRLPPPADRRRLRELSGFSVLEVAHNLGSSRQAVYQWESGDREPTGEYRKRYAAFLAEARRAMAVTELPDA